MDSLTSKMADILWGLFASIPKERLVESTLGREREREREKRVLHGKGKTSTKAELQIGIRTNTHYLT